MLCRSILFVDDDVLTQWVMTEALTKAGLEVASACRGGAAIELIHAEAEFDLLVTELDLPDEIGGLQVADHWRKTMVNRPVILIGSTGWLAQGQLGLRDIFLEKPFGSARLLRTIAAAMDEANYQPFTPRPAASLHHMH